MAVEMISHQLFILQNQLHRRCLLPHDPDPHKGHPRQNQDQKGHDHPAGPFGQIKGGVQSHPVIDQQIPVMGIIVENPPYPLVILVHIKVLAAVPGQLLLQPADGKFHPNGQANQGRRHRHHQRHAQPEVVHGQPDAQAHHHQYPGAEKPAFSPVITSDPGEGLGQL